VYLRRVKKRRDDKCWFCKGGGVSTAPPYRFEITNGKLGSVGSLLDS
jgi:hypothetical protein